MDEYDYVEYVIFDIHSIPRGRLLSRKKVKATVEKGIGLYTGICYCGIQHEISLSYYFGESRNYGNGYLVPIPETLVPSLKSAWGDRKVGQVLCQLQLPDGSLEPSTPRLVAQRLVEQLATLGLAVRSAFEIDFNIVDKDGTPWGHFNRYADTTVLCKDQGVLLDMVEELSESGVRIDTVQVEIGPGTFELTAEVAQGLEGPDMTSRFKSMSKVFLAKRNLKAIFMTKFRYDGLPNSFHFNHSLCTSNGESAFLDPSQPNRLSVLGQRWLAGLVTHGPALTALACPTVNCYRYVHGEWAPTKSDWGPQKRISCFRLVTEPDNVYIEVRLPSSASSPYLVMAGVLAAGMDGLKRQLALEDVSGDQAIPADLDTALTVLAGDTVLVEALGKQFVDCYIDAKRTFEINPLKKLGLSDDRELFEAEKKMYYDN